MRLAWILPLLAGCAIEENTAYQQCLDDPTAECCSNADCGEQAVCDFNYVCKDRLDGGLNCDAPTGTRTCHALCQHDEDCDTDGGGSCVAYEQVQGSEKRANTIWACF